VTGAVLAATAPRPDCITSDGTLCRLVYELTGLTWLAGSADWLIAKPLRILLILALAFVLRAVLHRGVSSLVRSSGAATLPRILRPLRERAPVLLESTALLSERRQQRAETLASVLRSIASFAIFAIAFMLILGELGINLAPIVASAGIVGVAVGFGAQNLVKDFLTGMFMILEDQYGVGDVVDVGEASGGVEAVGLRTTRLRDVNGVVWHVRNGEILRVGNMSQGWSRAVLDVPLAYGTDVGRARDVMKDVADGLWRDEEFADLVLEEPEVWGVEQLNAEGLVIRLVVKTAPLEQWKVARALRERLTARFETEGIRTPFGSGPVYVRAEGAGAAPPG